MDEFIKGVLTVPASNQMFVVAMACIVGFGWVFVKVLMRQTEILNNIEIVLNRQIESEKDKMVLFNKIVDHMASVYQELILHRQATERQNHFDKAS